MNVVASFRVLPLTVGASLSRVLGVTGRLISPQPGAVELSDFTLLSKVHETEPGPKAGHLKHPMTS